MKLDVLKKFATLVSVICVSFAAVGCAPPAEEAPASGDDTAAEETEGTEGEEAGTEDEGASTTE